MANLYDDLPVPLADGGGAAVDVSAFGRAKTISYQGDIRGSVQIQASVNGTDWRTIHTFSGSSKVLVDVAALFMRAFVSNFESGAAANMDVGANDNGAVGVSLPATAGSGTGAQVDVSGLGTFTTFYCVGIFTGAVVIEASADGVNWNDCVSFGANGGLDSKEIVAQFMRVRRENVTGVPGLPVIKVAAINDSSAGGPGGSPSGPAAGDLAGTYPNPRVAAITEMGGPTSLLAGTIDDSLALVRSGGAIVGIEVARFFEPDTTAAPVLVVLPASPRPGEVRNYKDFAGNAGTFPITFDGNGNTIDGVPGAAALVLSNDFDSVTLRFGTTSGEWNIVSENDSSLVHARGELVVTGGASPVTDQATNAVAGVFDVVTAWATAAGSNGDGVGATPENTNNRIVLDTAGAYKVSFSCSFEGSANETFEITAYVDGVAQPQCSLERRIGGGGDVGDSGFSGYVTVTAGQALDARVACSTGVGQTFTPRKMNLNATRVNQQ